MQFPTSIGLPPAYPSTSSSSGASSSSGSSSSAGSTSIGFNANQRELFQDKNCGEFVKRHFSNEQISRMKDVHCKVLSKVPLIQKLIPGSMSAENFLAMTGPKFALLFNPDIFMLALNPSIDVINKILDLTDQDCLTLKNLPTEMIHSKLFGFH